MGCSAGVVWHYFVEFLGLFVQLCEKRGIVLGLLFAQLVKVFLGFCHGLSCARLYLAIVILSYGECIPYVEVVDAKVSALE